MQPSLFTKVIIWLMVFLMSVGFAVLVIQPFLGGGGGGGNDVRSTNKKLVDDARETMKEKHCLDTKTAPTGATLKACKKALSDMGAGYRNLATPDPNEVGPDGVPVTPKDSEVNIDKAQEAFEKLYALDKHDVSSIQTLGSFYRDIGKYDKALPMFALLVKDNPDDPDLLLEQASIAAAATKYDEAIKLYNTAIKRFKDDPDTIDSAKAGIKQVKDQQKQASSGASSGLPAGVTATSNGQPISLG